MRYAFDVVMQQNDDFSAFFSDLFVVLRRRSTIRRGIEGRDLIKSASLSPSDHLHNIISF